MAEAKKKPETEEVADWEAAPAWEEPIALSQEEQDHVLWCGKMLEAGFHQPAFHGKGSAVACAKCEPRLIPFKELGAT